MSEHNQIDQIERLVGDAIIGELSGDKPTAAMVAVAMKFLDRHDRVHGDGKGDNGQARDTTEDLMAEIAKAHAQGGNMPPVEDPETSFQQEPVDDR